MTDPVLDAFDRELVETRDRSITALRQIADHRRVERLARHISASLKGENQADALLALTKNLGVWLRSMDSPGEALTAIAIITHLITREVVGEPDA